MLAQHLPSLLLVILVCHANRQYKTNHALAQHIKIRLDPTQMIFDAT